MDTIEYQHLPQTPFSNLLDLHGQVAVVTGGSSGIGRAIVLALAELGCEVWFCASGEEAGRATEADCAGGRGRFVRADVSCPEEVEEFIRRAADAHGAIDFLINNVANDRRVGLEEMTPEAFDRSIAVNLRSHFVATMAALPALRAGAGRSIVNVGTCNYMRPEADCTLYNIAKSGIVGLTHSLARELGREFIRVNTFTPGWVATPKQLANHMTPAAQEALKVEQALPMILHERDVLGPLLFLLSRASACVTGQNLLAEAGKVML